ncbi:hypothetical protein A0H81_07000 [Grifola frondosa]|uniref:DUF6570 domain-containing protein n=1 Tax=Grifola frondosa TaxID=5627 RepID=A0A1C7M7G9_GRIFR|nr:hypothetical protein A0H81_07000 [Grifola frondosa]
MEEGQRWCSGCRHQVTQDACQDTNGTLHATCQACRARHQARELAQVAAAQQNADHNIEHEDVPENDQPEGIQSVEIDEFDHILGDGAEYMNIDAPEENALNAMEEVLLASFREKLAALVLQACNICHEQGFDLNVRDDLCSRCKSDKGDLVRKFSPENNMSPVLEHPVCLRNLTDMEEMLISWVLPMMQVRYMRGRQLCYKEHKSIFSSGYRRVFLGCQKKLNVSSSITKTQGLHSA